MACHLFGAKPLSEPIMDYFELTLKNKLQWFFLNQNIESFMQGNAFENVICKTAAILSRPPFGNVVKVKIQNQHLCNIQCNNHEMFLDNIVYQQSQITLDFP